MAKQRTILHIDMDAFFAAVEQRDNPTLRGKPVAVGRSAKSRGVIAAASYEARRYGIRSAMPTAEAQQHCPDLILVTPDHAKYRRVSKQIMALLAEYTPLVEQVSIDEAFLDVTGSLRLHGSATRIGQQIRQRISQDFQLTASVGIGPNKFVAKLASEQAKPDGLLVIEPDQVGEFLAPLPVTALWGVGENTADKLHQLGFTTIGQLQQCNVDELVAQFGKHGRRLAQLARGQDDSPIHVGRDRKSVSHEQTFAEDIKDGQFLRGKLLELSEQVGHRLRSHNLKGRTVTLKLRFSDFRTITRSTTLTESTNADQQIYRSASSLLDAVNLAQRKVRLVGIAVSNLDTGKQPQLLVTANSRKSEVDKAIDAVRERFGTASIQRARIAGDKPAYD